MINQVAKKNPKRRFKEFLGMENWNVHTLGTVLMSMYNGQTPSRSKVEYWNGKINWLTSGELNCGIVNDTIEKITESGLDSANLKVIPKGILVIAITGLEASGTRGNCAILGCDTTLNQSCMALFPMRTRISSDFLFYWYLFIGDYYGIKYTQGTKQQSYNSKILNDLEIVIPSLDEQNKISSFFSKMDSMINLQQRKLDKLQATKKALLQEMFPEEGQDKPKRRFKGFTDAWEQRKLSEFVDKAVDNRGKTPPLDENGAHPLIEVAALGGVYPDYSKVEKYLSDDVFNTNLRAYIKKDDILFTTVGSIGLVSLMDSREEAAIAQNIVAFRAKENFLPEYLYALFSNEDNQYKAKRIAMVAVQPSIKVSQLVNVEYMISTNIEEQERIGVFFSNLQSLITLHQRKLDKLKNLKQAYLNEMFV